MTVVRRAKPDDVPRLKTLMLEYIVGFYQQPTPPDADLTALIETLLEGREGVQLVAEEDGALVGFATVYLTWSTLRPGRRAVMNDLYVTEDRRGSDAAAGLFRACLNEARAYGCNEMTWETAPDNHRAQRFYAKMGGRREDWLVYSIDPRRP